jgi:flagellar biosynthesis GTPase FlhF
MSKTKQAQAWPAAAANGNGAHTYRGGTLEELLPLIRDELGPDAIITRQREGVVGGIGGFFGKRCVEVEVRKPAAAAPEPMPVVPARSIIDAYDSPSDDEEPDTGGGRIMEAILAQTSPFADAEEGEPVAEADEPDWPFGPFAEELAEAVETQAQREQRSLPAAEPSAEAQDEHGETVEERLVAAQLPRRLVEELLAEAELSRTTFAPDEPLAEHARRIVARRLRVRREPRATPRRAAVVGPRGAGKTLAAARICLSYARGGRSVSALGLEPMSQAVGLASMLDASPVEVDFADSPSAVALACESRGDVDLLVADTPSVDSYDLAQLDRVARLLDAFRPTETHLVLPMAMAVAEMRLIVHALRARGLRPSVLVTHEDLDGAPATPVALALVERLPLSYVSRGTDVEVGLRPPEPCDLARLLLR